MYASGSTTGASSKAGLLYYQAGVAVLTSSVFLATARDTVWALIRGSQVQMTMTPTADFEKQNVNELFRNVSISGSADAFRHRLFDIDFNNTTELNSTIYFCRANHNEFNYSSKETFL